MWIGTHLPMRKTESYQRKGSFDVVCARTCLCVCICTCVCVCMCSVRVCSCLRVHVCKHMCVCLYACRCMCARVCVCVWGGLGISPRALYMLSMCSDIELTSQPHLTFISQILLSTYYVPRTMVDTGVGKRRSNPCVKNSFQYWWSGQ